MTPELFIQKNNVTQVLDGVAPNVKQILADRLGEIGTAMAADARDRAEAHIRFLTKTKKLSRFPPGSYLASITGGLAKSKTSTRVAGYERSGHPLAHLLELGVKAHDIYPKVAKLLAFDGPAGMVLSKHVNVAVEPYPALNPAFDALRPEIMDTFEFAKQNAGKGA